MTRNIDIIVPAMGESITEATITKWHKKSGDTVSKDEIILELETDKVSFEVTAPEAGSISEISYNEGATVEIGMKIATIAIGSITESTQTKINNSFKQENIFNSDHNTKNPLPAAEKILRTNGIEGAEAIKNAAISTGIIGTGRDQRLTKGDAISIANHIQQTCSINNYNHNANNNYSEDNKGQTKNNTEHETCVQPLQIERESRNKITKIRQTIARRLKESQNTAAILTTFNEVDMSAIIDLRQKYQDKFSKKYGIKIGFMSFFVKAVIKALKEFPVINASMTNEEIIYKHYYDIGIAVGTESGLIVPILRDADKMSLSDIEKAIGSLSNKAREGKISLNELSGGTFSITNGGIFGSMLSTPIINPPQSAILGMHNIVQRAIVDNNGNIVAKPIMYLALSYDHRLIDGSEAVRFLVDVKNSIEDPSRILLDV